ncbi:hypothetical protein MVEN_01841500 [Mycena venus]|uniref:DUF7029 domain-containing protein n=1 Tax=Mycena venus TaxID=2733690 RepID=A0A8H6XLC7_9AGAR|nr:hypothetical protein MVEN_01841500 [Mycena venus]
MIFRPLVTWFLFALLPFILAHTPKYRRTGPRNARHHRLHPTVHPDVDRTHPKHLTPNESLSLHYHDPHAAFPEIRSFASVHISGFTHPALLLEHSAHVVSTRCDAVSSTITVGFRARSAWNMALAAWKKHPKFFILAFEDSCGLGRESGERSVHLVHNMTSVWNRMEIICKMSELSLTEAIHPDRPVTIHADTFDVHDPEPPPTSSVVVRRAGEDETSDPSANPPPPDEGDFGGESADPPQSSDDEQSQTSPDSGSSDAGPGSSPDEGPINSPSTGADGASSSDAPQGPGNDFSSCDWTDLEGLSDAQVKEAMAACFPSNDAPEAPDCSVACHPEVEFLSYDQIEECFLCWGAQEEINEEQEGFYSANSLDENADSILGTSYDPDTVFSGGLNRRAQCKLTWNPIAMLTNCVILPVLKAVLPSAIYNIIDGILGVFDVKKLYEFFKTVVQVVVAVLSESGYTPSGEVTFDTNSSLIPLQNTSDFGCLLRGMPNQDYIGSDRRRQFMKHRSKFKFTLSKGFTSAEVELVDGSIDFAAGIGILFDLTYRGKIVEKQFPEIPLSPLTIPGIFVIGPFLQMKTGLDYELGAKGKVLARNNIGWSNMTAKLDMLDRTKSYTGNWTRHNPVPLVSVELEGYARLKPYVTAGLYFGVSILSGKLKVSTGIETAASLPVTASIAVKNGTDTAITFDKCKGVTVSLDAKLEIYVILEVAKYTRPYPIKEWEFPVYSKCIGMEIAVEKDKLAPNVPVPILPPTDPNATYRTINAQLKNQVLNVLWLPKPNGNLIAVPPAEVVDGSGSMHRLFQSLNTTVRNATAGVYDNRVLHFNKAFMYFAHVSPLLLSSKDAIPKNSIAV